MTVTGHRVTCRPGGRPFQEGPLGNVWVLIKFSKHFMFEDRKRFKMPL